MDRLREAFKTEISQLLIAYSEDDKVFNEVNNLGLGFFDQRFRHLLRTAFEEIKEVANFMYIYLKLLQLDNLKLFSLLRDTFSAEIAVYLDSKWKAVCENDTYPLPDITPERKALMYEIQEFYDTPPLLDKRPLYRKGGKGFHDTMDTLSDLAKTVEQKSGSR